MQAFEDGFTQEQLFEYTNIDPWFLAQMGELHQADLWLQTKTLDDLTAEDFLQIKKRGFSDPQIAKAIGGFLYNSIQAFSPCHLNLN